MSLSREQLQKHIDALTEFERKYGELLNAVRREWNGEGKVWSDEEMSERKREIQMLAVRADLAMKASGVGQILITHPPAMGGGIKSTDLPSQVFDFDSFALGSDGMEIQWQILARIPSQIAGLEVQLEEAPERKLRETKLPRSKPLSRPRPLRWDWINHPWTIAIVGGIVAAVIAGLIVALIVSG